MVDTNVVFCLKYPRRGEKEIIKPVFISTGRIEVTKILYATVVLAIVGQLVSADQQKLLTLSSACSDFSQNLYQKVAFDKPNIIYSPYSIHSVLSMNSLGAQGDTAHEMISTLGITSLSNSVHLAYKELNQQLNSVPDVHIYTGNAIFVKPGFQIVQKFIDDTANFYFAKADNIDMSANGGPEKPINDYIAEKTYNKITDVLNPGSIDGSTCMLLVNTIFFNGTWAEYFEPSKTRKQDFHQLGGAVKKVEMMHDDRSVKIKRDNVNGVDVAELSFKGSRFSMYIALPQKVDGITDLETKLAQPGKVKELFTGLNNTYVQLEIPKFKIETTLTLNDALIQLGIIKAFSPMDADFSGITKTDKVFISTVIHKAMIEVQETGTVAAAVTFVDLVLSDNISPRETFIVNHPFIYFLRDNKTQQILFQGKFSG